jgi:hypothetical protein
MTSTFVGFYSDGGENHSSSSANAVKKKGRGRPPKAASLSKVQANADQPKRGRGRPPKSADKSSIADKKPAIANKFKEQASIHDDTQKRKRGRPSKNNTLNEQVNGISKPQVNLLILMDRQVIEKNVCYCLDSISCGSKSVSSWKQQ